MICVKIKKDTLTPKLRKVSRSMQEKVARSLKRMLMYGKKRAQKYAHGGRKGQLEKGVFYRVYKKSGKGELISIARGPTNFPYNLWVNKDVKIRGRYPFFRTRGKVSYGQAGVKSPSGKPITWRVTPGYFTRTFEDMKRRFPKTSEGLLREILK